MATNTPTTEKAWRIDFVLGSAMAVLVLGVWSYELVQHIIEESGSRKFPAVAYASVWEYAVVAVVFLVGSFIGACSGLRLIRSGERSVALIGWLMVVAFSLFFFMSCVIYWFDYHRYASRSLG